MREKTWQVKMIIAKNRLF